MMSVSMYIFTNLESIYDDIVDAIREMRKYSSEDYDLNANPKAEMQAHMKLFRAQRNFYISGFALLLSA